MKTGQRVLMALSLVLYSKAEVRPDSALVFLKEALAGLPAEDVRGGLQQATLVFGTAAQRALLAKLSPLDLDS